MKINHVTVAQNLLKEVGTVSPFLVPFSTREVDLMIYLNSFEFP